MTVTFHERVFINDERHTCSEYRAKTTASSFFGFPGLRSSTNNPLLVFSVCVALAAASVTAYCYFAPLSPISSDAAIQIVLVLTFTALSAGTFAVATHVCEERVTIIAGLGVEFKTFYSLGMSKTRFLGDGSINAILIHESISTSQVHYSLAFMLQHEKRLVLCFRQVYPGLDNLRKVFARLLADGRLCTEDKRAHYD